MSHSYFEKSLAWCVHLFTASGLIAGFMSILAINAGDWRAAMSWLIFALLIDGIDGALARKFKVAEVLPGINGKTIDNVVDFANYAVIPAYFLYMTGLAGPGLNLTLAFLILIVSAVYYGKEGMVSDDFYFIGFPVMWNITVFYLVFVFSFPSSVNAAIVFILAVLHFVPVKFAYPSRATRLRGLTIFFTALLLVVMPLTVWFYPFVPMLLKWAAAVILALFGLLAVIDTVRTKKA